MAVCAGDLVANLGAQGKVGSIRPVTLWPFPDKAFENLPSTLKKILVVEMNHGQMVDDGAPCRERARPGAFLRQDRRRYAHVHPRGNDRWK